MSIHGGIRETKVQQELKLVKGVKGNRKDFSRPRGSESIPRRITTLQQIGKES